MFPCPNLAVQLAARFGVLPVLQILLEQGHTLVGADAIGRTALHWASRGGHEDIV
jgi:ankyrin repeat protein